MQEKRNYAPEQMREFEKVIVLRAVDSKWMDHIDAMDQLRQGIHLRAYGQIDPLREYQQEGFAMFEEMVAAMEDDVTRYMMKAEIRNNLERQEVMKGQAVNPKEEEGGKVKKQPARKQEDVGRNALCPCGSGKKYKNCHGEFSISADRKEDHMGASFHFLFAYLVFFSYSFMRRILYVIKNHMR